MGLTKNSVTTLLSNNTPLAAKQNPNDILVALCGNPNVGKSSIFNELTGLNQHTGNWPGKTVTTASGNVKTTNCNIKIQILYHYIIYRFTNCVAHSETI